MKNTDLRRLSLLGVITLIISLVVVPLVHATPTLVISDGFTTVVLQDGDAGDSNAAPDVVTFKANLGVWNINATGTTGIGDPNRITLGSVQTSTADGTLTLLYSDNGFGLSGPVSYSNFFGGVVSSALGDASATTWWAASNIETQKTTSLTAQGPFGGAFNNDATGNTSVTSPFSMTIEVTIDHSGLLRLSNFSDVLTVVPEPSALVLCGLGLVGLMFGRRFIRR